MSHEYPKTRLVDNVLRQVFAAASESFMFVLEVGRLFFLVQHAAFHDPKWLLLARIGCHELTPSDVAEVAGYAEGGARKPSGVECQLWSLESHTHQLSIPFLGVGFKKVNTYFWGPPVVMHAPKGF